MHFLSTSVPLTPEQREMVQRKRKRALDLRAMHWGMKGLAADEGPVCTTPSPPGDDALVPPLTTEQREMVDRKRRRALDLRAVHRGMEGLAAD